MGLIQPSRFQPTVFLLENFFFPCSKRGTLSLTGLDAFDGVVTNNNSNKSESSLRSFGLSAAFWMESLMARPIWALPGISASPCGCHWEAPGMGCRSISQIHPQNWEGSGTKGFAPGPCSHFKLHIETHCKILLHRAL